MLQPDVVARLRLLADTARIPPAADTTRVQQVKELTPGEHVTARVERELPNAAFHVAVRGKTFEMKLPEGFRQGHRVDLSYVGDHPRPTFLLLTARPGEHGNDFSQLGKVLATLLGQHHLTANRNVVQRMLPALADDPADTVKTPTLLRNALTQSGLFYESHQAQWVAGRLALEQLQREPQAPLRNATQSHSPADPGSREATTRAVSLAHNNNSAISPGERVPLADVRSNSIHPETFPIVRQQLDALDTRHVVWQGEAWPEQWMEWETGEDHEASAGTDQAAWYSTVTLELPALGAVRIRAVLADSGVRIKVECVDRETGARLQAAQPVLSSNLESRGIDLANLTVTSNEHA